MSNQSDNTLDEIIDNLVVEAVEKAITEWAGQECPIDASFYNITVVDAKQALTQWRDIAIAEARESTRKLYDKELKMHRDFMINVLARENLKTDKTMSICDVCLTQLQSQRDKLRKGETGGKS